MVLGGIRGLRRGVFDSAKDEWVRDLAAERLYSLKEYFSGDALPPHDYMAVYYQASMFFRFLDETYGAGTAARIFASYAGHLAIPMDRSSPARRERIAANWRPNSPAGSPAAMTP